MTAANSKPLSLEERGRAILMQIHHMSVESFDGKDGAGYRHQAGLIEEALREVQFETEARSAELHNVAMSKMLKHNAELKAELERARGNRCKHDVHGTDCFVCYPPGSPTPQGLPSEDALVFGSFEGFLYELKHHGALAAYQWIKANTACAKVQEPLSEKDIDRAAYEFATAWCCDNAGSPIESRDELKRMFLEFGDRLLGRGE